MAVSERLCVYPEYIDAEWLAAPGARRDQEPVLVLHPPPGQRPAGRAAAWPTTSPRGPSSGHGTGRALTAEELTALFAEQRPGGDRGHAAGRRRAAPAAGRRHGDLRGQPQHQRLQRVRGGLRLLWLRSVQALSRRLRALRGRVRPAGSRRRSRPARPRSASSPASTPTGTWRTTWTGCGSPRRSPRSCTCMRTRRWRLPTCATSAGCAPRAVFARAPRGRAGLDAGHGGRGPARRSARADLAQQAAGGPLGGDHRGLARRGHPLHRDRHVRPHRGALGAGRAHAGRARAAGAHRRLHRVRPAVLHPVSHAAGPHPRRRGDLPARRTSSTPPCSASRWATTVTQPPGQLGEDGTRRRHRGAALGGQRPGRDADGGVDLAHGRQLPRRPAGARGAGRRRPSCRPSGRRAHHAV